MAPLRDQFVSHLNPDQKDLIKAILARCGLYQTPPEQMFFEQVVLHSSSTFFIQVGANDGDDFVRSILRRYNQKRNIQGVLIEPQPYFFKKLVKNYTGIAHIEFLNMAISDTEKKATLYYVDYNAMNMPHWAKGLGSFNREVLMLHGNLISDLENSVRSIDVPCISMTALLQKMGDNKLDVLITDTEGHDLVILRQINFDLVKPKLIVFESKHLSKDDLAICDSMLKPKGYHVFHSDTSDSIAIRPDVMKIFTSSAKANYVCSELASTHFSS